MIDNAKDDLNTEVEANKTSDAASQIVVELKDDQQAKNRPLTAKERAYVKYRIEHPNSTKREAIEATHDVSPTIKPKTLQNMATNIEKRPAVLAVLQRHAEEAERALTDVMRASTDYAMTGTKEGAMYATVAERTANSILDRLHGKATQNVNLQSTSVNINVDLSQ